MAINKVMKNRSFACFHASGSVPFKVFENNRGSWLSVGYGQAAWRMLQILAASDKIKMFFPPSSEEPHRTAGMNLCASAEMHQD